MVVRSKFISRVINYFREKQLINNLGEANKKANQYYAFISDILCFIENNENIRKIDKKGNRESIEEDLEVIKIKIDHIKDVLIKTVNTDPQININNGHVYSKRQTP